MYVYIIYVYIFMFGFISIIIITKNPFILLQIIYIIILDNLP